MKKMFALFMALLLVLYFAACGSGSEATTEPSTEPQPLPVKFGSVTGIETTGENTEAIILTMEVPSSSQGAERDVYIAAVDYVFTHASNSLEELSVDAFGPDGNSIISFTMPSYLISSLREVEAQGSWGTEGFASFFYFNSEAYDVLVASCIYYDSIHGSETPAAEFEQTTTEPATEAPGMTMGQKNALASAMSYLRYSAFSHDGLIEQLEFEGYTTDDATFAADNCGADWNEQALASALSYLNYTAFSYTGLIEQLEFEKFTTEQATYGADNCGADWNEQAAKSAESYLEYSSFSKTGLIDQLEFEGFTHEQAVYGVEANGY